MPATRLIVALLTFPILSLAQADCKPQSPCYTAEGVVNSASFRADGLAPYTFVTLFGTNLAYKTRSRVAGDTHASLGGVNVVIDNNSALVFYVSPTQINLLVPFTLKAGESTLRVAREGLVGPPVKIRLADTAPALFQSDAETALALRFPDWSLATRETPAAPGDWVILYATGLGNLALPVEEYQPPKVAVEIARRKQFRVYLDGVAVDDGLISYAGSAPGFAGLYQINLLLPDNPGINPEIRIGFGESLSPEGVRLPLGPPPVNSPGY